MNKKVLGFESSEFAATERKRRMTVKNHMFKKVTKNRQKSLRNINMRDLPSLDMGAELY